MSCCIIFSYISSKVIPDVDILLSSDIFLDSIVISIHVLYFVFVPAIVMLGFKKNS